MHKVISISLIRLQDDVEKGMLEKKLNKNKNILGNISAKVDAISNYCLTAFWYLLKKIACICWSL